MRLNITLVKALARAILARNVDFINILGNSNSQKIQPQLFVPYRASLETVWGMVTVTKIFRFLPLQAFIACLKSFNQSISMEYCLIVVIIWPQIVNLCPRLFVQIL